MATIATAGSSQLKLYLTTTATTSTSITVQLKFYHAYKISASATKSFSIKCSNGTTYTGSVSGFSTTGSATHTLMTKTFTGLTAGTTYTFTGSLGLNVTWYVSGTGTYVGTMSGSTTFATSAPTTYTIAYSANGGSGAPSSQTKTYGTTLTLSSTKPTRTGYTFSKWNTNSSGTGTSYSSGGSYTTNAAATLYAVWTLNTYTISYSANGGSGAPSSQTKSYGTTLTLSSTTPTRTGYTFKGWSTSSSATSATYSAGGSYTSNSAATLYAVWSLNTYTVSYSANGGSGAPSSQTKSYGTTLTLSSTKPTRTGYSFSKWNTSSGGTGTSYSSGGSYTTNAAVTLYAVWTAYTYTISYNANGGSGAPSSQTKTYGTTLTLRTTVPTKEGYDFKGWSTSSSATSATYSAGGKYTSNSAATLYAVWSPSVYTITYDANGGVGAPTSQSKGYQETLTISSEQPTRAGHSFLGWGSSSSSSSIVYYGEEEYSDNSSIVLYAVWKPDTYLVTYDSNEGNSFSVSQIKTYGETLVLTSSTPTRDGYDFVEWNTVSSGAGISYSPSQEYTSNTGLVLYAIWKIQVYKISYDANGGIGAPDSQEKTFGVPLTITQETPSLTNYKFMGWNTAADGSGSTYLSGRFYSEEGDKTLYAIWAEGVCQIKYDANGGESAPASQIKIYGKDIILSVTKPYYEGKQFVGWGETSSAVTATYNLGDSYTKDEDLLLYAIWIDREDNIIFNSFCNDDTYKFYFTDDVEKYSTPRMAVRQNNITYYAPLISAEAPGTALVVAAEEKYKLAIDQAIYNNKIYVDFTTIYSDDIERMSFASCEEMKGFLYQNEIIVTAKIIYSVNDEIPMSFSRLFEGCINLKSIDFSLCEIQNLYSLSYAFKDCAALENVSLNGLDTLDVQYAQGMFMGCTSLRILDLTDLKTENIEYIHSMFEECVSLESLNILSFDTSNVINMSTMFYNCSSLTVFDLTSFDMTNVEYFEDMFVGCSGIVKSYGKTEEDCAILNSSSNRPDNVLFDIKFVGFTVTGTYIDETAFEEEIAKESDLQSFITDASSSLKTIKISESTGLLTTMSNMFYDCSELTKIDLLELNLSNVTSLYRAFYNCSSLVDLDTSNWDTSKIYSVSYAFYNCSSLVDLDTSNWDTSTVSNIYGLFYGCSSLVKVDTSNWDISKVSSLYRTFYNCSSLTELDVSKWDVSKNTTVYQMFYNCSSLTELDVSEWEMGQTTVIQGTFYGCSSLTKLDVSKWDVSKSTSLYQTFYGCSSLTELDVSEWDVSNSTNMSSAFQGCSSLIELDISKWNTSNSTAFTNMFESCTNLTSVLAENIDTSKGQSFASAFSKCKSLVDFSFIENWNVEKATNLSGFLRETGVRTVDLSKWTTTSSLTNLALFAYSSSLEEISIPNFVTSSVVDYQFMFAYTPTKKIDLSSFEMASSAVTSGMFTNCTSVTEAYGRTQADCDILNASTNRPSNINFIVKSAYATLLYSLDVSPAETEEEQIEQLIELGIDYTEI